MLSSPTVTHSPDFTLLGLSPPSALKSVGALATFSLPKTTPQLPSLVTPLLFSPGKVRPSGSIGGVPRGPSTGPDLIVDDGGDATLLIHEGVKAEEVYEKTGTLPDPASSDNAEFQIVLTIIRDGLKSDPKKYTRMKERLVGVSQETTTGCPLDLHLDSVVKRAQMAVQSGGVYKAMLWFQGESDTLNQEDAELYKGRLKSFFNDLRSDLKVLSLPIFQIAADLVFPRAVLLLILFFLKKVILVSYKELALLLQTLCCCHSKNSYSILTQLMIMFGLSLPRCIHLMTKERVLEVAKM
ncbi:Adenosylhomocysteinase [Corchorus olitorius]|uniref:Adenosylhomocysteinase n=1 Tax=Corchorus olitorius TaxID=93759 RepID=A0A1R3JKA1_9ROSI|nr:Adenosylhomocysteinase [Corchorus olitorius]